MTTDILLPQLGTEITEAEVTEWLKAEGDLVAAGEQIVLITTPKLTMELEAPAAGRLLAIRVAAGDLASTGDVLGVIGPA